MNMTLTIENRLKSNHCHFFCMMMLQQCRLKTF